MLGSPQQVVARLLDIISSNCETWFARSRIVGGQQLQIQCNTGLGSFSFEKVAIEHDWRKEADVKP